MEISVDVATWSRRHDAAILQIGAIAFDFDCIREPHDHIQRDTLAFAGTIDPQVRYDAHYDQKTVAWWGHAARQRAMCSILEMPVRDTAEVILQRFVAWIPRNLGKRARVWARSPQFDLAVLRRGFDTFGIECPWEPNQEADVRTIVFAAQHVLGADFLVPDVSAAGMIEHNALHTAALQATLTQAALRAVVLHDRKYGAGKKTVKT